MPSRLAIMLLSTAVLTPPLTAQMHGSAGLGRFPSGHFSSARGISTAFARRHASDRFAQSRRAFADPYLYSDYYPDANVIQSPAPEIVVLQAAPAVVEAPPASPRELLIEWRGNHYERVTSAPSDRDRGNERASDGAGERQSRPAPVEHTESAQKPRELPPAVLLFRDGRQEEVSSYSIVGAVIYCSMDYWSSGSWNKKIQLADLDLPATLKMNRERGVPFVLPSASNEIVTRP